MIKNKIIDNKLNICTGLLFIFTYLLNFHTKVYQCALLFTIIAITNNCIMLFDSRSKSLNTIAFAIIVNFILLWKIPYYINGKIVNGLVFTSFFSLIISIYCSTALFEKLTKYIGFITSNALAVILAAIVDGLIMSIFFILNNKFSYSRVLDIFHREVSYKIIYILVASFVMNLFIEMIQTRYSQTLNRSV